MPQGFCDHCNAFVGTVPLTCPVCGALVHAARLEQLAAQAQAAAASGDLARARQLWAEALPLLPESTVQHTSVSAKIAELDAQLADAEASSRLLERDVADIDLRLSGKMIVRLAHEIPVPAKTKPQQGI